MPIEPTSVSKPAIREIEKPSANFSAWTSLQGSSTGGKDRPANSIWEKAINGAQKLFGLDASDPASSAEDSSEKEDRVDKQSSEVADTSYSGTSGFGNRSFGSFGASVFGGNTFGSVATSRAAPQESTSQIAEISPKEQVGLVEKPKVSAKEQSGQGVSQESQAASSAEEQERLEEGREEAARRVAVAAKSAGNSPLRMSEAPIAMPAPLPTQIPWNTTDANLSQSVQTASVAASSSKPVVTVTPAPVAQQKHSSGTGQSSQASVAAVPINPPANPVKPSAQVPGSALPNVPVVAEGGKRPEGPTAPVNPLPRTPVETAESVAGPAIQKAELQVTAPITTQSTEGAPQVLNEGVKKSDTNIGGTALAAPSKLEGEKPVPTKVATSESLGIDLEKAKESLGEALAAKTISNSKPASGPAITRSSQTSVPQPVVHEASGSSSESSVARTPEPVSTEAKETTSTDAAKRELASVAQLKGIAGKSTVADSVAQSRSNSSAAEGAAQDSKAAHNAASTNAASSLFARESATAATRIQTTGTPGKGTSTAQAGGQSGAIAGVSGGQGLGVGTPQQGGAGAQNQGGGDAASKKDFANALTQSAKTSEKPTADSGTSFEAKVEAASSRRADAASKSRQTSYVSKTAEEVKETIATLAKSIDRLVTNKTGAMNLKINFEGGGSVNLRISMDGGQVSTAMQTDVVGLEAAIKANWGELANDWNQKGVKLSTPVFQNSESSKGASFDDLSEFASRQDRQSTGQSGDGRDRAPSGRSTGVRGFSNSSSDKQGTDSPAFAGRAEVVSDKELKTYA